jgi:sulfhydrogenase subunit alpha
VTHKGGRELSVAGLARVEGEGAMRVRVEQGMVSEVSLQIYEPPRFFEAFLRGRAHTEPPDITSRICGICPIAYQTSACLAIEDACGVTLPEHLTDLRRFIYCGEWISSHALHVYLLQAPDFLGVPSVVELAQRDRAAVRRGLALKKAGNLILELLGGRAIHPINMRLGGFYAAPSRADVDTLIPVLRRALDDALATVDWVAGFEYPEFSHGHELLALVRPGCYAIESGQPRTDRGFDFDVRDVDTYVIEDQVPHSTALQARLSGRGMYLTGPLARYTINQRWLSPLAKQAATAAGLGDECRDPFRAIAVRAVELVYAAEEALRLAIAYEPPSPSYVEVAPRAGVGAGATEAPRGTLFQRYSLDDAGLIQSARIVPPTSQNQAAIEADLRRFVQARLDLDDHDLTHECERAIRTYDPCISCATHFLDLTVERI